MALDSKSVTMGSLLILFIGIVVVLALVPTIANTQKELTSKLTQFNDSDALTACYSDVGQVQQNDSRCNFTVNHAPASWQEDTCQISSVVIRNGSGSTALAVTTDYIVYAGTGIIAYQNSSSANITNIGVSNVTYITYDYCTEGYITNSAGRSVANLIMIFVALALLAYVLYYSMKTWQK